MNVQITKALAEAIGYKNLKFVGLGDDEQYRWNAASINLSRINNGDVKKLRELIAAANPSGKKVGKTEALRDLDLWIAAAKNGAANVKCTNTKHFAALVHEYLQTAPLHRLFKKDEACSVWCAYYVGSVTFHEKQVRRDGVEPAYTDVELYFHELGTLRETTLKYKNQDVCGLTVPEALMSVGYLVQTPELAAAYDASTTKYNSIFDKVGMQFLAIGVGTDDLDGNTKESRDSWARYYGHQTLVLERDGAPSRVVIDVRSETDRAKDKDEHAPDPVYWRHKTYLTAGEDESDNDIKEGDEEVEPEIESIAIPTRHIVPCFDLKRHLRLRIHTDNLIEYVYDETLTDKLILPPNNKYLVKMLMEHNGGFNDIVAGKGGGSIIMCAGIAGAGKTLTAECYAEAMKRPLYSVQCSQLGTDPDELEGSLLKVFARAQRWNAILLLDEADVYVAKRGSDLIQNAIVGVFLRVLEYYTGALFLTTNRGDLIDDAIASRCLARINYTAPLVVDQVRIWEVLSATIGVKVPSEAFAEFAAKYPNTTGRDVKNLLKLAMLVSKAGGTAVNLAMLEYVKQFKPTDDALGAPATETK